VLGAVSLWRWLPSDCAVVDLGYSCSFPLSTPKSVLTSFLHQWDAFGRGLGVVVKCYFFTWRFGTLFCVAERVLLAVYAILFFVLPIGCLKARRCRPYFFCHLLSFLLLLRRLGLVYAGRVPRFSEMGPVTRLSHFFLVAVHTTLLVLVSSMSLLCTSWRRQRLALEKCLTGVYGVGRSL
jgi:hypothetical protein